MSIFSIARAHTSVTIFEHECGNGLSIRSLSFPVGTNSVHNWRIFPGHVLSKVVTSSRAHLLRSHRYGAVYDCFLVNVG